MGVSKQFAKNLQPFCLVSFDVVNTLLRHKSPVQQYAETAAKYGHSDLNKEKLAKTIHTEYNAMMSQYPMFGRDSPEMDWYQWWIQLGYRCFKITKPKIPERDLNFLARQVVEVYRTNRCWTRMDGALEMVDKLQQAGKSVGVIANYDPSITEVLNAMGFSGLDFVVNSYDCGVFKPDKEIFQEALRQVRVPSRQALHIGDDYCEDYMGATNCGWTSLLISPSANKIAKKKQMERDHAHKDLLILMSKLDCIDFEW